MAGDQPPPREPQVSLSTRIRDSVAQRLLNASAKLSAAQGKKVSQASIVDTALDEWLTQHDL